MFDLDLIQKFYSSLDSKVKLIRQCINKPLTLTEKILYSHCQTTINNFKRGSDYVNFNPDRVGMQDATAQMALLQFIVADKNKVAVPTTVHADHLIQAKLNSEHDLKMH